MLKIVKSNNGKVQFNVQIQGSVRENVGLSVNELKKKKHGVVVSIAKTNKI